MIAGQHKGAGLHTDEADREDSAQVARYLILVGWKRRRTAAETEYSVIVGTNAFDVIPRNLEILYSDSPIIQRVSSET